MAYNQYRFFWLSFNGYVIGIEIGICVFLNFGIPILQRMKKSGPTFKPVRLFNLFLTFLFISVDTYKLSTFSKNLTEISYTSPPTPYE